MLLSSVSSLCGSSSSVGLVVEASARAPCRKNKVHSALKFLEKALAVESGLGGVQTMSDTHLNLCAVLSQLGR